MDTKDERLRKLMYENDVSVRRRYRERRRPRHRAEHEGGGEKRRRGKGERGKNPLAQNQWTRSLCCRKHRYPKWVSQLCSSTNGPFARFELFNLGWAAMYSTRYMINNFWPSVSERQTSMEQENLFFRDTSVAMIEVKFSLGSLMIQCLKKDTVVNILESFEKKETKKSQWLTARLWQYFPLEYVNTNFFYLLSTLGPWYVCLSVLHDVWCLCSFWAKYYLLYICMYVRYITRPCEIPANKCINYTFTLCLSVRQPSCMYDDCLWIWVAMRVSYNCCCLCCYITLISQKKWSQTTRKGEKRERQRQRV